MSIAPLFQAAVVPTASTTSSAQSAPAPAPAPQGAALFASLMDGTAGNAWNALDPLDPWGLNDDDEPEADDEATD